MNKIGIYSITNPKNKVYIGSSKNIYKRWDVYKKLKCKQQIKIYNSLKKYGVNNHVFKIEIECLESELYEWEHHYSNYYDSVNNGLNCRIPGYKDVRPVISSETIKKMVENHPIKTDTNYINKHKNKLKEFAKTEKYKQRMAEYWSSENKLKASIRVRNYYKTISDDRIKLKTQKMIKTKLINNNGEYHSKEFKENLSKRYKGKTFSKEHKEKLSQNNPNKKKIICIESGFIFDSISDVAKNYSVSMSTIKRIILNKTTKNKLKLNFKYYDSRQEEKTV